MTIDDKKSFLETLNRLNDDVKNLSLFYEKFPELNSLQPDSFSKVIPASLDEWYIQLVDCRNEWLKALDL